MASALTALCKHPGGLLALGFGAGLAPRAPGTFGSLVGVVLGLLAVALGGSVGLWAITLLAVAIAPAVCGMASARLGDRDHPAIVWDEIAGYLVTVVTLPHSGLAIALGFGMFRAFDILKPWPIRVLERRLAGGLGIAADDWLAGVLAAASVHLILRLL